MESRASSAVAVPSSNSDRAPQTQLSVCSNLANDWRTLISANWTNMGEFDETWRREWDSNPRYAVNVHTLSKRAP